MTTGIEAVGFALAIFPIAVQGIETWYGALGKMKQLRFWEKELENIQRELRTEYVLYRNICWTLLEGCGYEGDIEDLMDGNAEKWKASDFRNRLEEYMGQDMANAFFLESSAFCRSLRKLIKKLKIDDKLNKLTPCALGQLEFGNDKSRITASQRLVIIKSIMRGEGSFTELHEMKEINKRIDRLIARKPTWLGSSTRHDNFNAPFACLFGDTIDSIASTDQVQDAARPSIDCGHQPAPYSKAVKHLPLPVSLYCLRSKSNLPYSNNAVALGTLLENEVLPSHLSRLELGVLLALEAISLHGTIWKKENWGKYDIFFLQTRHRFNSRDVLLEKPLVRRIENSVHQSDPNLSESRPKSKDFLVSLGIVLVELFYGMSFDKIFRGIQSGMMTLSNCSWVCDKVSLNAGQMYGDAVRRCIMGIDHANPRFGNREFRDMVDREIIEPPVKNLESHRRSI